jgi:hypothetical protein
MSKFTVAIAIGTVALAATLFAPAAMADDPGANPAGNWVCLTAGATGINAQLTMTDTDYAFTPPGATSSSSGSYQIDRNVITVTSGPLKDELGLGHGYFNTRATPFALTFASVAGSGMTCNPDIYL